MLYHIANGKGFIKKVTSVSMNSKEIRRLNMLAVVEGLNPPTFEKLAELTNKSSSYFSQIKGNHRGMGDAVARDIEEAVGLPDGYMDVIHEETGLVFSEEGAIDVATVAHWRHLNDGSGSRIQMITRPNDPDDRLQMAPVMQAFVPIVSWVEAGSWSETIDTFEPGDADEWQPTTKRVSTSSFALRVSGDSMTAPHGKSFPDTTIIIVDPEITPHSGSFVVARLDQEDEATFKQLVFDGDRRYLKPLNPQYPTLQLDQDCTICGVVVQAIIDI